MEGKFKFKKLIVCYSDGTKDTFLKNVAIPFNGSFAITDDFKTIVIQMNQVKKMLIYE